jgi:hypothetical protein
LENGIGHITTINKCPNAKRNMMAEKEKRSKCRMKGVITSSGRLKSTPATIWLVESCAGNALNETEMIER